MEKFQNVNAGRAAGGLDDDLVRGFKGAVNTRRTLLALEYAVRIIEDQQKQLDELKKAGTLSTTAAKAKPAAKATKKAADAEEPKVEETPKEG
jgi:hypothetical protein